MGPGTRMPVLAHHHVQHQGTQIVGQHLDGGILSQVENLAVAAALAAKLGHAGHGSALCTDHRVLHQILA